MEVSVAEETTVDEEEQDAVKKEEAEIDEDTGGEIFYVDLDPDTGSDVANDGLGHAVDAYGLIGEGILEQADGGAGEGAGNGIAARDGEEDGNDKREVEDGQTGKGPGKQSLQQNRGKWHQNRYSGREAVLLEFAAGCIAAGGHIRTVVSF